MARRALLGTALLALVLSLWCSAAGAAPQLRRARASAVARLPIPAQAQLVGVADGSDAAYVLPAGITLTEATRWYRARLPLGRPWHRWQVCPAPTGGPHRSPFAAFDRTWTESQPNGSTVLLSLHVAWQDIARTRVGIYAYEQRLPKHSLVTCE